MSEILLLVLVVVAIVVLVTLFDIRAELEESNSIARSNMSKSAEILASLTASEQSLDQAVTTIINMGQVVQAIGDDVTSLKLLIENGGDLNAISARADAIASKRIQLSEALATFSANLSAVDEQADPPAAETEVPVNPPVTDPPAGPEETGGGSGD